MVTTIIRFSSNTTYDPSYTVNLQTPLSNAPLPLDSRQPVQTYWGEAENRSQGTSLFKPTKSGYKIMAMKWQETKCGLTATTTLIQFLKKDTVKPGEGGDSMGGY